MHYNVWDAALLHLLVYSIEEYTAMFPKCSKHHGLNLAMWFNFNPNTWMSNYIYYKVWHKIIYQFPNFNGEAVEVWEWINNFIAHFTWYVITYPR